uniref:Uncharacterized protein n=1 Tax=Manihot esculenta TaxID=3983 RepID=A0A2C9V079_MANES
MCLMLESLTCDITNSNTTSVIEESNHSFTSRCKGVAESAGSNNSRNCMIVSKFIKLDFSHFNCQEDPLGWLSRCEHLFQHRHTSIEEKVNMASFHLEEVA